MIIIFGLLGLILGSFFAAWTWRIVNNKGISEGRSFCPSCMAEIAWYDNVPLLSYLLLGGKCRKCGKRISARYPIIESMYLLTFVLTVVSFEKIQERFVYLSPWGILGIFVVLAVVCFSLAVLIVDYETQIIPDTYTFSLLFASLLLNLDNPLFFAHLLTGLVASLFLLSLNVMTNGRGMGLGDVKLAVPIGLLLGPLLSLYWMMGAFVLGAIIGIILLMFGTAELKSKIAFGPFLIISFFVVVVCATIKLI